MELKPGYKRTEVGVIPEEWPVDRLDKFWSVTDCKHVTAKFVASGYPLASIKEVQSRYVELADAKQTTRQFYDQLTEGGRAPRVGDLIISRNATVGEVAQVADWHPPFAMGQDVCLMRKRDQEYSTDYLQAVFRSPVIARQLADLMVGSTFKRINVQQIKGFCVPMPLPREQRTIATALSDVDALLTQLDRLIAKKRDIKQAVMQELLTGKTRLPGFGGEWVNGRLDEVALVDPESLSGSTEPDYSFNYISLENVARGTLVGYSEELFASAPSRARRVIRHVDILVSTVRPNLKSHLLFRAKPGAWICSTGFSVIRCRPEIAHPEFVFQHLFADNITKQIDALLTGSNYPAINSSDVRGLTIPIPSIEEQTAIATLLSDLDAELAALEPRRDKTRALKQGMMQELLTGRTRLVCARGWMPLVHAG